MATIIGSLDLNAFSDLYSDSTQYFWFEGDASATYGAGVHITLSPDTSFISNPTGQNILMNTDGISMRNGLLPMMVLNNNSLAFNVVDTTAGTYTNVASFGNTVRVGDTDKSCITFDSDSIEGYGESGKLFFEFNGNGAERSTETLSVSDEYSWSEFVDDGKTFTDLELTSTFSIQLVAENTNLYATLVKSKFTYGTSSTVSGTKTIGVYGDVDYTITYGGADTINVQLSESTLPMMMFRIWINETKYTPTYSLGASNSVTGSYAFAEGYDNTVSGNYSHAEGYHTTAGGVNAHAEGWLTKSISAATHAEGYNTTASGPYSHAQNAGTVADQSFQTAIGRNNTKGNTNNLFVVGNGASDSTRSDAFTVDTYGNVVAAGEIYTKTTSISLGHYFAPAVLTQASGRLYFNIPTGRVFPSGTTVSSLTCTMMARAGNKNGTGMYIIKSTSGGSSAATFDSTSSFVFYNGANSKKTLSASNISVTLQGGTNIYVILDGDPNASSTYFFSGSSTNNGYINNQPTMVTLYSVVVTLNIP